MKWYAKKESVPKNYVDLSCEGRYAESDKQK